MKRSRVFIIMAAVVAFIFLFGACGKAPESPVFRENDGWLEWKYESADDGSWEKLYRLEDNADAEFEFVLNGDLTSYSLVGISNMTSEKIEIPSEYNGKPVTKISSVSPMNYSGVREVIIPSTVTEIGERAFLDCTYLEKVTVPDSVTKLGEEAFYMCSSLKEISINVETIEAMTFYECTELHRVELGERTKTISDQAFSKCDKLSEIVFNDGLERIGSAAFMDCKSLTGELTLPSSVCEVGSCAFSGTELDKLVFSDTSRWVASTDVPGSKKFFKLDLSDPVNNVELIKSYNGVHTWKKGVAVGVTGDIEPFAAVTSAGYSGYTFSGFDIDVIKAIDEKLEDLVFGFVYAESFDEAFLGIDDGEYDIVISALEYTEARAEKYSVSSVYYTDGASEYVIYGDKEDGYLMQTVNGILAELLPSESYAAMKAKYGLT